VSTTTVRIGAAASIALTGVLLTGVYGLAAGHATVRSPLRGATAVAQPSVCKGYKTYGVPDVAPLNTRKTYKATVTTNKGTFTITFYPKQAPVTVASFIFLAQHRYFDGASFHRIVPTFVIQGGDPTGTGICGPGYQFGTENTGGKYYRGTVAMARTSDPHSNGSQFFVVLQDNGPLNQEPNYSIFGKVTSGMDTVDRIANVPLGPGSDGSNSSPQTKIYMKSVRVTAN